MVFHSCNGRTQTATGDPMPVAMISGHRMAASPPHLECGCEARNERSHRFPQADQLTLGKGTQARHLAQPQGDFHRFHRFNGGVCLSRRAHGEDFHHFHHFNGG